MDEMKNDMGDIKADWNAGDEFCRFIIEMEREAFKARSRISDGMYENSPHYVAKCMDDWFECLQNIYDKVCGYMEDLDQYDTIEKEIETLTNGDYFANVSLDSENLKKGNVLIRHYGRLLSIFLARAGIYMKTDIKVNYKNMQDKMDGQYEH